MWLIFIIAADEDGCILRISLSFFQYPFFWFPGGQKKPGWLQHAYKKLRSILQALTDICSDGTLYRLQICSPIVLYSHTRLDPSSLYSPSLIESAQHFILSQCSELLHYILFAWSLWVSETTSRLTEAYFTNFMQLLYCKT